MTEPSKTTPIQLRALTGAWDEQVSIFDDLLGDPLALVAASTAKHELQVSPEDDTATIHPGRGSERVGIGHTMDQVRATLGEPGDVTDFQEAFGDGYEAALELFGITWHYEALGVEVEFQDGVVAALVFHSGTYRGGLIPRSWKRWEGLVAPDLPFESVSEEGLRERLGPPLNAYDNDPELCEICDEEPTRRVVYPGWSYVFQLDGQLEAVLVPGNSPLKSSDPDSAQESA